MLVMTYILRQKKSKPNQIKNKIAFLFTHQKNDMNKVCIVFPCYNEQNRLESAAFINSYQQHDFHFLFVNDGSTDKTMEVLEEIKNGREDKISILDLKQNIGKAEAVRLGMLHADATNEFSIIGFLDADLSTPITEIPKILSHFKTGKLFVFGSRFQRIGVTINRKVYRHYLGRVFATVASNMLKIPVYDTQCGAKFFKSDVIALLFNEEFKSNWTFDLEIFYRLLAKYKNTTINDIASEIPLEKWEDKNGSKIKLKHLLKVPFDLIAIYLHYNSKMMKG